MFIYLLTESASGVMLYSPKNIVSALNTKKSDSLIGLVVSVDIKHHVCILTY